MPQPYDIQIPNLVGEFYRGKQMDFAAKRAPIEAQQNDQMFAQKQQAFGEDREKEMVGNMAGLLASAPAQHRPQMYAQMKGKLAGFAQKHGLPLPEMWDESYLDEVQQLAQALGKAGRQQAMGVQSTYIDNQGNRVAIMRDGSTQVLGQNAPNMQIMEAQGGIVGVNKSNLQAAPVTMGGAPSGAPQVSPMQLAGLFSKFGGTLTSGYRSPAHNAKVGGVPNSQHMQGTGQDWVFPPQVKAQAAAFARAQGYEVIDEGDHLHFELPRGAQGGQLQAPAKDPAANPEEFGQPQTVMGPDGKPQLVQFGNQGGQRPVSNLAPGPTARENKPPTEAERNAAGYLSRMEAAERELEAVVNSGYDAGNLRDKFTAGNGMLNYMASDKGQQYRQQQEDWVRAKLRKESGAVIGEDEMEREIKTYFPQPGDGDNVIANKKKSRQIAIQAMRKSGGRAVDPDAEANAPESNDYSNLWK